MNDFGLQVYTIRDYLTEASECEKAYLAVKEIGYSYVQLAGSKEMLTLSASVCKKLGIKVYGILTGIDFCYENSQFLFALAKEVGATDIGISGWVQDMENPLPFIEKVNTFALLAKENGFTFSYHNHACEFVKTANGKMAMDVLIENFLPIVNFMPDTYWLQHGGQNITDFLMKIRGRMEAVHLKDMKIVGNEHTFAEIGQGTLNFDKIIATAKECGAKMFIVEQDSCDGDSLTAIKTSGDYLKSL